VPVVRTTASARSFQAIGQADATHRVAFHQKIVGLALDHFQTGRFADRGLNGGRVELPIGLGAGPMHRRTFAPVQDPKLNAAAIGGSTHQTIQGVDLTNQMTLAEPADGWIAGHRAHRGEPVGQQCRVCTHPRSCGRGFTAGVPATDHNDVERIH
jgi:hypothetical protein